MKIDRAVKPGIADGVLGIFAFANEAYNEDADFAARMISLGRWLWEDPATGSATPHSRHIFVRWASAAGSWLSRASRSNARPRLYLEVADEIRVGGRVLPCLPNTQLSDGRLSRAPGRNPPAPRWCIRAG